MNQKTVLRCYEEYNRTDKKLLKANYIKYLKPYKLRALAARSGIKIGTIYQIKKPCVDYVPDFMLGMQLCLAMGIDIQVIMKGGK